MNIFEKATGRTAGPGQIDDMRHLSLCLRDQDRLFIPLFMELLMKKIEGDVNLYAMEIPVIQPRHVYIDSQKRVDYLTSPPGLPQPPRKQKANQPPVYTRSKPNNQVLSKTQE